MAQQRIDTGSRPGHATQTTHRLAAYPSGEDIVGKCLAGIGIESPSFSESVTNGSADTRLRPICSCSNPQRTTAKYARNTAFCFPFGRLKAGGGKTENLGNAPDQGPVARSGSGVSRSAKQKSNS